ncbi:DUF4383 domain-containing protein [Phytoactinopolyspora mesophila]|uniref:DUF4383 domain-containing protein n=1 Tax=Phytoactinopolyspora mesophila TaxID=2650750 RepID=A0A7K3M4Z9_9ACTN|nr:DUF4383 domain-containing protein [Phytoactinopolyspora mesophila]NDL58374.1 DUF4383 domain-containing protein [Phytoactinopolyspora mesophila]
MTPAPEVPNGPGPVSSPVRIAAYVMAVALLIVGVLGFVPGATSGFGDLEFTGPDSGATLFGTFAVSGLLNLVHLIVGGAGLIMARFRRAARVYLFAGGLVYLAMFAFGVAIDHTAEENVLSVNEASNWLHLGIGVLMVLLGFLPAQRIRKSEPAD